jgi:hypothetical protein
VTIGQHNLNASLPFVVECKSTHPFFEVIAAFNVKVAAEAYAGECSTSNPSFEYRVVRPLPPIPNHDTFDDTDMAELLIVGKLVKDVIAAGLFISVWDGEEMTVVETNDADEVFKALASTDGDVLYVHKAHGDDRPRFVSLIWGNGCDVISDYNTSLEDVLKGANDLAGELDR